MSDAIEGELEENLTLDGNMMTPLQQMQELVDKHEQEGLHRIENKELRVVLDELKAIGLSNLIDLFEHNPFTGSLQVKKLEDIPREVMAGVKSIKVKRDRLDGDLYETVEFTMHDKPGALDKLMRYYGAYAQDNAQKKSPGEEMLEMVMSFIGSNGMPKIDDNSA